MKSLKEQHWDVVLACAIQRGRSYADFLRISFCTALSFFRTTLRFFLT